MSVEEVTHHMAEYIIQLKHEGVLSATQVCILCYWGTRAGFGGLFAELAMKPLFSQTGAFSRKSDHVTGVLDDADEFYSVETPVVSNCDGVRTSMQMPTWPPHDSSGGSG